MRLRERIRHQAYLPRLSIWQSLLLPSYTNSRETETKGRMKLRERIRQKEQLSEKERLPKRKQVRGRIGGIRVRERKKA